MPATQVPNLSNAPQDANSQVHDGGASREAGSWQDELPKNDSEDEELEADTLGLVDDDGYNYTNDEGLHAEHVENPLQALGPVTEEERKARKVEELQRAKFETEMAEQSHQRYIQCLQNSLDNASSFAEPLKRLAQPTT